MNHRFGIMQFIFAAVLVPGMISEGSPPPPPPTPDQIEAARHPEVCVERAPAAIPDRSGFVNVQEKPTEGIVKPLAVIDMSRVPVSLDVPPDAYSLSHHQGSLIQNTLPADLSVPGASHEGKPSEVFDASEPSNENSPADGGTSRTASYSFDAGGYSGWIPPDTQLAVGPEYIIEAVNSGFSVYSKGGSLERSYTNFESFVSLPSPWNGFCYDPRLIYSNEYGKYLMMIMGRDDTNLKSYFWLLVSQSSNPNGNWWQYRFDVSAGAAGSEEWLDYAAIGVDHWGVYVTGNYFFFPHDKRGVRTALWSISPDLMSGLSAGIYVWDSLHWPSGAQAFTMQPANPHSQNYAGNTFYVNTYSGSGSQILLWTQSGKRYPDDSNPDAANLSRTAIDCKQYYAMGNHVDQPGSAWDIDGGDTRVMDATYSLGKVYATLALNWDGNLAYSEAYIIALDTDTGTKAWDRSLWNSSFNIFFPALTVDGSNADPEVMLSFSVTEPGSTTGYAGTSWFQYNNTANTSSWLIERWGEGPYSRWDGDYEGDGRNRWGDYSGADWDWTCNVAWGAAEYATSSNTWATQIFSRTLGSSDPCTYIHVRDPNGTENYDAGDTVTIQWDRTNIDSGDDIYLELWNGVNWSIFAGPLSPSTTSYTWSVSNIDTNAAKIFVGAWDAASSSWSTSDTSDAAFTINGKADIKWSTFDPPASVIQGETVTVGESVQNIGVVSSGAFTIEFRLSSNTTCTSYDTLVGSRYVASMSPDSATGATTPISIPSDAGTGTQYLCMMVDPDLDVDDFDLSNNTTYKAIEIIPAEIFSDGFESGGTNSWTVAVP